MTELIDQIKRDQIAGHEAAIDKFIESIGDRMETHGIGKAVIDLQINQDIIALRILTNELKEMQKL